ncbi:hypothetical protein NEOLI_003704 [Neolecta irregularis DAH-3]|uniref:Myb-like domain-containing protein n=1 Tax=Neolecta irregularis (strain DAH-3) TaxID=1198029 RepID=A0A1U7LPN4_NEOID|nr:hypothetical protein NEOLI_003704 [Neolecta irregularis DAH-3]|eukprot:OLL24481.1 hypothetical protein NEOLI_003704 [Neolecta irregularis DAH-3]
MYGYENGSLPSTNISDGIPDFYQSEQTSRRFPFVEPSVEEHQSVYTGITPTALSMARQQASYSAFHKSCSYPYPFSPPQNFYPSFVPTHGAITTFVGEESSVRHIKEGASSETQTEDEELNLSEDCTSAPANRKRKPRTSNDIPPKKRPRTKYSAAQNALIIQLRQNKIPWKNIQSEFFPMGTINALKVHYTQLNSKSLSFTPEQDRQLLQEFNQLEEGLYENLGNVVGKPSKVCQMRVQMLRYKQIEEISKQTLRDVEENEV